MKPHESFRTTPLAAAVLLGGVLLAAAGCNRNAGTDTAPAADTTAPADTTADAGTMRVERSKNMMKLVPVGR